MQRRHGYGRGWSAPRATEQALDAERGAAALRHHLRPNAVDHQARVRVADDV